MAKRLDRQLLRANESFALDRHNQVRDVYQFGLSSTDHRRRPLKPFPARNMTITESLTHLYLRLAVVWCRRYPLDALVLLVSVADFVKSKSLRVFVGDSCTSV